MEKKKEKSGGKVNSDMKEKRGKKAERKVSYPVDQLLPLSVKVMIAEHALVCVYTGVCVLSGERRRKSL